ncbi:MAG: MaoC family dehydratase [Pyrinomonadaceae bacterium]|nr:MaoC family dehydratase [Pyrinomonadaceae bacterium]
MQNVSELSTIINESLISDWFEVSQNLINLFAEATKDSQWIHVDAERARSESPFGTTIAHGFLTLSLLSHLSESVLQITNKPKLSVNYGFNKVRFAASVTVESKIRLRITLKTIEEIAGGSQMTWDAVIESEDSEKPNVIAEWITRYYL